MDKIHFATLRYVLKGLRNKIYRLKSQFMKTYISANKVS